MLQVVVANIVVGVTSEPCEKPSGSPYKADALEFDRIILLPAVYQQLMGAPQDQRRPFQLFNPETGEMFVGCWFHHWKSLQVVSDNEDEGMLMGEAIVFYEARGPRQEFLRPVQEDSVA
jgi:hypothetical protein